jgi:Zn-dependent M28 family amino/carboxypeptidase
VAPKNRVRFAFWGAEEEGLLGSTYYVSRLTPARLAQIKMNLNFDMVASPNGTLGVYDGDLSDTTSTVPAPPGSDAIEQAFLDAFGDQPTVPADFSGRSDYRAFQLQGIPAGGLFTGAEVPKTAEEAAIFGGVAGEQLDPCYHEACDTLEHVMTLNGGLGLELLDKNSNAAAAVLWDYAQADQLPGVRPARAAATRPARRALRSRPMDASVGERAAF